MIGQKISPKDINEFIESELCKIEYSDQNGNSCTIENALVLKFKLNRKSKNGDYIYGVFRRKDTTDNFMGITWENAKTPKSLGIVNDNSLTNLCAIADCTINDIEDVFVVNSIEYFNVQDITNFQDGTVVDEKNAKFIRFKTTLKNQ